MNADYVPTTLPSNEACALDWLTDQIERFDCVIRIGYTDEGDFGVWVNDELKGTGSCVTHIIEELWLDHVMPGKPLVDLGPIDGEPF